MFTKTKSYANFYGVYFYMSNKKIMSYFSGASLARAVTYAATTQLLAASRANFSKRKSGKSGAGAALQGHQQ